MTATTLLCLHMTIKNVYILGQYISLSLRCTILAILHFKELIVAPGSWKLQILFEFF